MSALSQYGAGAVAGIAEDQYRLGLAYRQGTGGVECDKARARALFLEAAQNGSVDGMAWIGLYCSSGEGGVVDSVEAVRWSMAAANAGNGSSQYNVAHWYEEGRNGLARDIEKAKHYYALSAAQGDKDAKDGVERLSIHPLQKYGDAAAAGDPAANEALGGVYYYGRSGVAVDKAKARPYYLAAAKAGKSLSQHMIGFMLVKAEGGAADVKEGVRWTTEAAKNGQSASQYNLGVWHEYGHHGVTRDVAQAKKYYQASAAQGDSDAAEALQRVSSTCAAISFISG